MKPDDTTLALWLDDELEGEPLARVEAWAAEHPEQLAAREEIRRWRRMISGCLPREIEPPAPEFLNQRILHAIERRTPGAEARRTQRSWWRPLAACAAVAAAFLLGYRLHDHDPAQQQAVAPAAADDSPVIYTPEPGIQAEWRDNEVSEAGVIILNGIEAIADTIEFSSQTDAPCQEDAPQEHTPAKKQK
ncbi:MAG TPA: hypothetical protein VFY13_00835 [Luteolibacter sp.]|nr:hypothetical protein [Luteolibacter sp.]